MKPSAKTVLHLLRRGPQTTHDLLVAGCGSRFGARIHELRELGFVIGEQRLGLPTRGSRYTLVSEPQPQPETSPSTVTDGGSLFDSSVFAERGGYRDTERAA